MTSIISFPRQRGAAVGIASCARWISCVMAVASIPAVHGLAGGLRANTAEESPADGMGWVPFLEFQVGNELLHRAQAIDQMINDTAFLGITEFRSVVDKTDTAMQTNMSNGAQLNLSIDTGASEMHRNFKDAAERAYSKVNGTIKSITNDTKQLMFFIDASAKGAADCSASLTTENTCESVKNTLQQAEDVLQTINNSVQAMNKSSAEALLAMLGAVTGILPNVNHSCTKSLDAKNARSGLANMQQSHVHEVCIALTTSAHLWAKACQKSFRLIQTHLLRFQAALPILWSSVQLMLASMDDTTNGIMRLPEMPD